MGIDGIPSGQIRLNSTEVSANYPSKVGEVDKTVPSNLVKEEEENKGRGKNKRNSTSSKASDDSKETILAEDILKGKKDDYRKKTKYTLKFSKESDIIMLYDTESKKIVQAIPEQQFIDFVLQIKGVSGITFSEKM